MLSVIIDAQDQPERLMGLLAALAEGVVEGVVREVHIVAQASTPEIEALCEETGARISPALSLAAGAARSDLVLLAPTGFRPRDGWTEALARHLRDGGTAARLEGRGGGFLRRAADALVAPRDKINGANFAAVRRAFGRLTKL